MLRELLRDLSEIKKGSESASKRRKNENGVKLMIRKQKVELKEVKQKIHPEGKFVKSNPAPPLADNT